jgi:hemerythrin-like domain-containing protein
MMLNLLGNVPDFDEPIEAMMICHEQILARMQGIENMCHEIVEEGLPAFSRQLDAWREAIRFIRHNIERHTRDEEEGLFPMIAHELGRPVDLMLFEHRWIKQSEQLLFDLFDSLTGNAASDGTHVREFAICAKEIAYFYRNHIREEDEVLFPAAKGVLTAEQKKELGDLMRKHRDLEEAAAMAG